ncbi:hypothetical protein MXB_567, partial [Myxobolus squamalis]
KLLFSKVLAVYGCFSIILLHLVTRGYVNKIHFSPDHLFFKFETIGLFSFPKSIYFNPKDVKFNPKKLINSIEIHNKFYFIDDTIPQGQEFLKFVAKYKDTLDS